ncbi:hypothetical protein OC845_005626 [Tilletia horrida]|nr:hypothetical protein OC845_005626 [Tilletia horrida]
MRLALLLLIPSLFLFGGLRVAALGMNSVQVTQCSPSNVIDFHFSLSDNDVASWSTLQFYLTRDGSNYEFSPDGYAWSGNETLGPTGKINDGGGWHFTWTVGSQPLQDLSPVVIAGLRLIDLNGYNNDHYVEGEITNPCSSQGSGYTTILPSWSKYYGPTTTSSSTTTSIAPVTSITSVPVPPDTSSTPSFSPSVVVNTSSSATVGSTPTRVTSTTTSITSSLRPALSNLSLTHRGVPIGALIGGVLAGVIVLLALLTLCTLCYKRRVRKSEPANADYAPDVYQAEAQAQYHTTAVSSNYSAVPIHDHTASILSTPTSDAAPSMAKTPGSAHLSSAGADIEWTPAALERPQRPFSLTNDFGSQVPPVSEQSLHQKPSSNGTQSPAGEALGPSAFPTATSPTGISLLERHLVEPPEYSRSSPPNPLHAGNLLHLPAHPQTEDLIHDGPAPISSSAAKEPILPTGSINSDTAARKEHAAAPTNPLLSSNLPPPLLASKEKAPAVHASAPVPPVNEDIIAYDKVTLPKNPLPFLDEALKVAVRPAGGVLDGAGDLQDARENEALDSILVAAGRSWTDDGDTEEQLGASQSGLLGGALGVETRVSKVGDVFVCLGEDDCEEVEGAVEDKVTRERAVRTSLVGEQCMAIVAQLLFLQTRLLGVEEQAVVVVGLSEPLGIIGVGGSEHRVSSSSSIAAGAVPRALPRVARQP